MWRFRWLILLLLALAVLSVAVYQRLAPPVYRAALTVQITDQNVDEVSLLEQSIPLLPSRSPTSINNFVEVVQQEEVFVRTRNLLELTNNFLYGLEVRPVRNTDFVELSATAGTPELAAALANTHASTSIQAYGELRALPASALRRQVEDQLLAAEQALTESEDALMAFQLDNSTVVMAADIAARQQIVEEMTLERDRLILESPIEQAEEIARINGLIQQRRIEIEQLTRQLPEFNRLQDAVTRARETYDSLSSQLIESSIEEDVLREVSFIQIARPALPPTEPVNNALALLAIAIGTSLLLGILLALFFNAVVPPETGEAPAALPPASTGTELLPRNIS